MLAQQQPAVSITGNNRGVGTAAAVVSITSNPPPPLVVVQGMIFMFVEPGRPTPIVGMKHFSLLLSTAAKHTQHVAAQQAHGGRLGVVCYSAAGSLGGA